MESSGHNDMFMEKGPGFAQLRQTEMSLTVLIRSLNNSGRRKLLPKKSLVGISVTPKTSAITKGKEKLLALKRRPPKGTRAYNPRT